MRPIWTTLLMVLFLALEPMAFASTTWYVNGTTGSDNNDCKSPTTACKTIGHAISLATSGDSISVAAATYTENLTIGISLKILGASATTTIIDGGGVSRVVDVLSATNVVLSNFTIRNGKVNFFGGGIYNLGTLTVSGSHVSGNSLTGILQYGGGVYNGGTLTLNNSVVTGNIVTSNGFNPAYGGGVYNSNTGTLTITNSTLSVNTANVVMTIQGGGAARGAGIANGGVLTINNSTLSGNDAITFFNEGPANGGGIYILGGSTTIINSTLSNNIAGSVAGSSGGGIYNGGGNAILQNSIVASNSGGNCSGSVTSNGYNLSSDGTCNFNSTGDLNNTDPKLGPLQNNGGPTQTQALLPGSPAIDAGNPSGCTDSQGHPLKTDQRGAPRPDKEDTGGCDMGAYERQND